MALFGDKAHSLNGNTLTGRKRLMEVVEDSGGRLSVVLAGHPKLHNELRRPTMGESVIASQATTWLKRVVAQLPRLLALWTITHTGMAGRQEPDDVRLLEGLRVRLP